MKKHAHLIRIATMFTTGTTATTKIKVFVLAAFAIFGIATAASASVPSGPPASTSQGAVTQSQDYPFGIANFNCADIQRYNVDKQLNIRAAAIMQKCGHGPEKSENKAAANSRGSTGIAALDQLTGPLSYYGGTDVNVILPDGTYPKVTQSETFVWGDGDNVVVNYNDSRTTNCYGGVSYSLDGGTTWTSPRRHRRISHLHRSRRQLWRPHSSLQPPV